MSESEQEVEKVSYDSKKIYLYSDVSKMLKPFNPCALGLKFMPNSSTVKQWFKNANLPMVKNEVESRHKQVNKPPLNPLLVSEIHVINSTEKEPNEE